MQVARAHEVGEQLPLAVGVDEIGDLLDRLRGRDGGRDVDRLGVVRNVLASEPHLAVEGGREEQVLALGREHGHDASDVVDEAHVQHAVGLVEDEHLDLAEVERAAAGVVEQAPGRGHHDLDAAEQVLLLRAHGHAAVDDGRAQTDVLAVVLEAVVHLDGQLARGRHHQHADRVARRGERLVGLPLEPLQDGQREGGGLAGAGLGSGHEVPAA